MTPAQQINQTSGDCEYYTPGSIIEAARRTMGWIDLDPASSEKANSLVGASRYYDRQNDGLKYPWIAESVFLNHPFGRKENPLWINKLLGDYKAKLVTQACCLTYACTSELWFRPLLFYPQCFLFPRTNYLLPDGTVKRGVTKGSVVTYLGQSPKAFSDAFKHLGVIKVELT